MKIKTNPIYWSLDEIEAEYQLIRDSLCEEYDGDDADEVLDEYSEDEFIEFEDDINRNAEMLFEEKYKINYLKLLKLKCV